MVEVADEPKIEVYKDTMLPEVTPKIAPVPTDANISFIFDFS